jgi:hypothetical protein
MKADGEKIIATYGNPPKRSNNHHVYADKSQVDPLYKAALERAGKPL